MKKVILFGASVAGKIFIENNEEKPKYEILAIADNDKEKQGRDLLGYPVISPDKIKNYNYDEVIISSMFFTDIRNQLVDEIGIEESKVVTPYKILSKSFEDPATIALARELLVSITDILDEAEIRYFLAHGGLLGLVRDGDLIPWDNDIDLAVEINDMAASIQVIEEKFNQLPKSEEVQWKINLEDNEDGELVKIIIFFDEDASSAYKFFDLSIEALEFKDGKVYGAMFNADEKYFLENDYIDYKGKKISIPNNYEEYLDFAYGDWRTPRQEMRYTDCGNFNEPRRVSSKSLI